MSKLINNPHDKTFKKVLSDKKLAKRFFKQYLPYTMQKKVDLDTLELQKGSFVDDNLSEHLTDLLFSVDIDGSQGYTYLLVEHQSTTDELMAFRLLKYMVNIMQHHLTTKKTKKLPLVLPLVYYVGTKAATGFIPDIMDCFANPEMARHHFLQPFTLIDLQKMSDDAILKDKALAGLELLQKHIRDRDLTSIVHKMLEQGVFVEMHHESGQYFEVMLKYMINSGNLEDATGFLDKLADHLPDEKERIMTIAEQLEQKGERKAKLAMAANLLHQGVDKFTIAKASGLDPTAIEALKNTKH